MGKSLNTDGWISERLKTLIDKRNINGPTELARLTGMNPVTTCAQYRGDRRAPFETCAKYAQVLDVDTFWLYKGDSEKEQDDFKLEKEQGVSEIENLKKENALLKRFIKELLSN